MCTDETLSVKSQVLGFHQFWDTKCKIVLYYSMFIVFSHSHMNLMYIHLPYFSQKAVLKSEWVGLRPMRKPLRLEKETLNYNTGSMTVCRIPVSFHLYTASYFAITRFSGGQLFV